MRAVNPVIYLARIVIEAKTPLALHTGHGIDGYDTELVRDANGLPMIPGTSIAGVLRLLWLARSPETVSHVFGDIGEVELASRVTVSSAAVHGKTGAPVAGLASEEQEQDPLLAWLRDDLPVYRDNVRLTYRGAAKEKAKFDRVMVPAGTRFTFELKFHSPDPADPVWLELLGLLEHPRFRLGAATRSGLGGIKVISVRGRTFDLRKEKDFMDYAALPRKLSAAPTSLPEIKLARFQDSVQATLRLKAVTPWRVGAENAPVLSPKSRQEKEADGRIMSECVVEWLGGLGKRSAPKLLVPGSSVKGALSHRILFHYLRFTKQFADISPTLFAEDAIGQRPDALRKLLGDVAGKNTKGEGGEQAWAGAITLDDLYLKHEDSDPIEYRTHNSIDRFTGGTRDSALYSDELVLGKSLELTVSIDPARTVGLPKAARLALDAALRDLAAGRLALGAGASKGQGVFEGECVWSEQGRRWLDGEDMLEAVK